MMIELKTDVSVRIPDSDKFALIKAGSKANYSSSKSPGEVWTHRFSTWHRATNQILQYAETIQGNGSPSWL